MAELTKIKGKVTRKSKEGNMLEIASETGEKDWYFLANPVKAFVATGIKVEDEVEASVGEGPEGATISFISKKGGASFANTGSSHHSGGKTYGKSPEEQESIKKLAVLKAASDAVATCMAGRFDNVDVLGDAIVTLYNKLLNIVNQ